MPKPCSAGAPCLNCESDEGGARFTREPLAQLYVHRSQRRIGCEHGDASRGRFEFEEPHEPPSHWRLGFWSLIITQFQGAFNDNGLKFLVFYLVVERNFAPVVRDRFILLVGALFAIPFILFSLAGGYFADRYSKRSVTIGTKLFEIGVGLFAIAALAAGNLTMEAAAVFLISTQGALFGPSKYGLLPELLPENKLSWGNGVIELGTFLASITAVMFAGFLADALRWTATWPGRSTPKGRGA